MIDYSQPDFYKFTSDSIELINFILNDKEINLSEIETIYDLCSGSGVLGIELYLKIDKKKSVALKKIYFIEKQSLFIRHLIKNINYYFSKLNIETQLIIHDIIFLNFNSIINQNSKNLLIMNPPFFIESKTRKSENNNRNICRIISKENLIKMYEKVINLKIRYNYILLSEPKIMQNLLDKQKKSYTIIPIRKDRFIIKFIN